MNPEEAYLEKQVKAEEEKLGRKVQALTDADRKEIYQKGSEDSRRLQRDRLVVDLKILTLCASLVKVWSCWLLRVKLRTLPVYLPFKYLTLPPAFPSRRSRWALPVGRCSLKVSWSPALSRCCVLQEAFPSSTASSPPTAWSTSEPCAA